MSNLTIFLFGRPQCFVDGVEARSFNTRKDCALLAYLAATGVAHSREHLAGLLWSDLPEDKARRNLRHALSHLHKVVGPVWFETENGVGLTRSLPWTVDVQRLQSAVGRFAPPASLTLHQLDRESIAALDHALHGYRGAFLQEFYVQKAAHFEEWVLAQREEYHLLALRGLEIVAQDALAGGDSLKGLAATRRLLKLEPWSETAHCLQMQLLVASGQRAAALAQYEICRQLLAAELGVAPMPETTALHHQIQTGSYHGPVAYRRPESPVSRSEPPQSANAMLAIKPSVPHNLHTPLSGFVGRQRELEFMSQRLDAADCRLLTIVGPGGMGKTSLALALGQRLLRALPVDFPDGIFFVALLDVATAGRDRLEHGLPDDPAAGEAILHAIAEQIGYKLEAGVSATVQLQAYLHTRRLLLILDNFEHLLAGADAVVTLLTKLPHLKALVTSRARLNVRGERVLTLAHLSLPTAAYRAADEAAQANPAHTIRDDDWQASEAIAMFVQRAQQFDPDFAISAETIGPVGQICQLVEGLPLGIELATSMLPMFSCAALASALARSLDFLAADMRDLPSDQRTLAAVFERSWHLLPPEAQLLLARLSIFPGSFGRDAAEQIAGASSSLLRRLIDQSLVSQVGDERYVMHRTIHAFAQQKLQRWPEQLEILQVQYAHFYLEFLARSEAGITGAAYAIVTEQIQADLDNVGTAWRLAVTHQMFTELNRGLNALFLFYEQQGFYLDAFDLWNHTLRHFLPVYEAQDNKSGTELIWLIGRLQTCFGLWSLRFGRFQQAQAAYASSWSILQHEDRPDAAAICLGLWGGAIKGSNPQQSVALLTDALQLAQTSALDWLQSVISQALGETIFLFGNYSAAEAQITAGYLKAKQINWPRGLTSGAKALGRLNLSLGHYRQAEAYLRESIGFARRHHLRILGLDSLTTLGEALRLQGRLAEAKACFAESRQLAVGLGSGIFIAPVLWEEGCLAEQNSEYLAAKALFTESLAIGLPNWWCHALPTLGWALIGLGELDEAQIYFQKVLTDAEAKQRLPIRLDAQAGLVYIQGIRAGYDSQTSQALLEDSGPVLRDLSCNPAATAETRQRINTIIQEFGLRLIENSFLSQALF